MIAGAVGSTPAADLAVVVVNYNAGEYLARCVSSVVGAAAGITLDLLIVDNASHDDSARSAVSGTPDAGWKALATPVLEVMHVGGVSTGRSRRTHLMHSQSIYRYYRKHRANGWRRATLPLAWTALRVRAELVAAREAIARHE